MLLNSCCCKSCLIFKDDFNRANGTNIGPWTESGAGNASISNGVLTITGQCRAVTETTHPDIIVSGVVEVTILPNTGSLFTESSYVILNYKDTTNYLYVEFLFTFFGAPKTEMKFFRKSGGVATQQGATRTIHASAGIDALGAKVCYDGNDLRALGEREPVAPIADGYRVGVEFAGISTSAFSNFKWSKSSISHDGCPTCNTSYTCGPCTGIPDTVIVEIGAATLTDGAWSACDQIAGEFILSDFRPPVGAIYYCEWVYTRTYQSGSFTACGIPTYLQILARLTGDVLQWNWVVAIIGLIDPVPCCNTGNILFDAEYISANLVAADCPDTSIVLSKNYQRDRMCNGLTTCSGTLPANITLTIP